jgi:hypothetical protein
MKCTTMKGAREGLFRLAVEMCRLCRIDEPHVEDVALGLVVKAWRRPWRRRYSALVDSIRQEMARQWGVPRRTLPTRWSRLVAIGQFESQRRAQESFRSPQWGPAFDRHSRRFAIENGVCPRCAARGRFTESGGKCRCGFCFD